MKLIIKLVIALVVLVVLLLGGVVFFAGKLVKTAIEEGGSYALGVPTEVERVHLGLLSGEFALKGLRVANPEGFAKENFLSLENAEVQIGLATLTSDRIEAPLLLIDGFTINLERRDNKTNYGVILRNLEKLQKGETGEPESEGETAGGGPTLLIREIVLRNITAYVDLVPLAGDSLKKSVTLKELRLENVGDTGESLAQMIARLTTAVLQATVESLDGVIPPELLAQLQGDFANLDEIKMQLQEEAQAQIDEKIEEAKEEARKEIDDAVKKGLDSLFKKD